MNCPICGSKLYKNQVCKYCTNITIDKIKNASNKKAKQAIKNRKRENVVYSTYLPNDINKVKLWLLTVLLGAVGAQNFYVGKIYKGWFHLIGVAGTFFFGLIEVLSVDYGWGVESGVAYFTRLFAFAFAIGIILWVSDIFAIIFKKFKVPVMLD